MKAKLRSPITAPKMNFFQNINIVSKYSDQNLTFEASNIFAEKPQVGILALRTWSFFAKMQISTLFSILVDHRIKPKIDSFSDSSKTNF